MNYYFRPVKSLIRQIQLLLKEYLTSSDLVEAMRCVRELEVPHFHHELVYEVNILEIIITGHILRIWRFPHTTQQINTIVPST